VRLVLKSRDTVRFEVPVAARRCGDGRGILMHGARGGQGVLVWLRSSYPPDTGVYPLLPRGDSVALRGVIAAVRFQLGDVPHGLALDEDRPVTRATPQLALQLRASASRRRSRSSAPPRSRSTGCRWRRHVPCRVLPYCARRDHRDGVRAAGAAAGVGARPRRPRDGDRERPARQRRGGGGRVPDRAFAATASELAGRPTLTS
jgi:hypothetical protein